jgi:hypothetical protein
MNPLRWKRADTFAMAGTLVIVAVFVLMDLGA